MLLRMQACDAHVKPSSEESGYYGAHEHSRVKPFLAFGRPSITLEAAVTMVLKPMVEGELAGVVLPVYHVCCYISSSFTSRGANEYEHANRLENHHERSVGQSIVLATR
jgi:hypothetical protein